MSSRAKSLPTSANLVSMILIVSDVLLDEFQFVENCCQVATVVGAAGVPIEISLNRISNVAVGEPNQLDVRERSCKSSSVRPRRFRPNGHVRLKEPLAANIRPVPVVWSPYEMAVGSLGREWEGLSTTSYDWLTNVSWGIRVGGCEPGIAL